jgi:hypothetical protein
MATNRYTGLWFPILLGLLLLLVVPAGILLLLALLGYEGTVNAWLWHNFGIKYQTYLPAWAAFVLLLLPLLVVLLYFLKMKRKPVEVPSTFLWRKSIEDLQVNSFFQWLRNNVLLLLQLLIILVLIYTALSLQSQASVTAGKHFILLIDNSSSMNTVDVAEGDRRISRLVQAKREALAIIDAHREGDVGMVIEFNSESRPRQDYTSDRNLLRSAVQRIQPTNRTTRIDDALALADSLANPRKSTENQAVTPQGVDPGQARQYVQPPDGIRADVHIFSDGGFVEGSSFAAGNLSLLYHQIGTPGADAVDNVGIVDCNASREPGSNVLRIFVRAQNFRKSPLTCKLELELRPEGQRDFLLRERELTMKGRIVKPANPKTNDAGEDTPGEAVASFDLELDPAIPAIVIARLGHGGDHFPLDDEVRLAINPVRRGRVLIVTAGNPLLSYFFDNDATRKVARVSYLKPEDLKTEAYLGPARNGEYDLVIFDRCAPADKEGKPDENLMPLANTFFIGDVPPPWKRSDLPDLKGATIRNPTSPHELMQGLTELDEIPFTGAFRFELDPRKNPDVPPRTARLLECEGDTAVLFLLERRAFRDLVLAFPIVTVGPDGSMKWYTLWPIRPKFPLFLRNVLLQLGNVREDAAEENVRPGQTVTLRPDAAVETVTVRIPQGKLPVPPDPITLTRSPQGDFLFKNTEEPGLYRVEWDGGARNFAVNLLDEAESNVQPRDIVQIGEQRLAAEGKVGRPVELWKWAALIALVLLLLEWAFYHHRILH